MTGVQTCALPILQRPNYEIGEDFQLDLFRGLVNKEYFINFINESKKPLFYLKLLDDKFNLGVPEVRFPVTRRLRDSKGYFWADFKQWNIPFDVFIDKQFMDLDFVLNILKLNFNLSNNDIDYIKKYAEEVWCSI